MSLEQARLVYPILVRMARELSDAVQARRPVTWVSYEDFCEKCREVGVKETPRSVSSKLLKPIQAVCLEKQLPDISALIIQKPRSRTDSGNLIRPSDGWWEPYVERGETTVGDVSFWFTQFRLARDYENWPEAPFF